LVHPCALHSFPTRRSSDLIAVPPDFREPFECEPSRFADPRAQHDLVTEGGGSFVVDLVPQNDPADPLLRFLAGSFCGTRSTTKLDRKSTRLNSSHVAISYA